MSSVDADGSADFDISAELGGLSVEPVGRGDLSIKPWHKPRKQYVRSQQWAAELKGLLAKVTGNEAVGYFTLGGADLLDVFFLGRMCYDDFGRQLRYLSINNAAADDATRQNVVEQMTKQQGFASEFSLTLVDDLGALGNLKSQAYSKAADIGPFDAINLDLCSGVWGDGRLNHQSVYSAINALVGIQNRRDRPWLLFLSTRVDADSVKEALAGVLAERLAAASEECPDQLGPLNLGGTTSVGTVRDLDPTDLAEALVLLFLIWFQGLVHSPPGATVSLSSCATYRIHGGAEVDDFASLVIKVEPVPSVPPDPSGIAAPRGQTSIDTCAEIGDFIEAIRGSERVDQLMEESPSLRSEMLEESADLLASVGYDRAAYVEQFTND